MHLCNWLPNTCLEMDLVSWCWPAMANSIPLPLDLGKHVVINHTSICTLVKSLPGTRLWVNVAICCLGIASFGSWTVMLLSNAYYGMGCWHYSSGKQLFGWCWLLVETQLWLVLWPNFQGFKDYIWLVSTLRLQMTSPSDLPTLPRNMPYYRGPQIKVDPPTLANDNKEHQRLLAYSVLHSHHKYIPIYPTAQFNLETLTTLYLSIAVTAFGITMSSQYLHFTSHNSTG